MGWTAEKDIHWIGYVRLSCLEKTKSHLTYGERFCVGAACIGLGFFTIFQSAISYLVDTYLMLSASALAANLFVRSILAAAFPLFSNACE